MDQSQQALLAQCTMPGCSAALRWANGVCGTVTRLCCYKTSRAGCRGKLEDVTARKGKEGLEGRGGWYGTQARRRRGWGGSKAAPGV